MRYLPLIFLLGLLSVLSCSPRKKTSSTEGKMGSIGTASFRKNMVDFAQKQVGVPYKYAGKTPATGFDCSGFTSFVFKKFNVEISPASKEQARTGREIPLQKVKAGDLVFFGKNKNSIDHVGMVVKRTSDGIFCVHSTSSRGVIVENVSVSTYWKPRILFARDVLSN